MHLLQYFDKLSLKPENAKELKGLILDLAIRGRLTEEWRKENPDVESASILLKRIKEEKALLIKEKKVKKEKLLHVVNTNEKPFQLPVTWKFCHLTDLGIIGSSKRVHKRDWQNSGVPFYRAREIVKLAKSGKVDNDLFISNHLFEELSTKGLIPKKDDIMITGVGTIGIPYLVKATDLFYFKDASVLIFKNIFSLYPNYLINLFLSNYWKNEIHKDSMGTTVHTFTISRARATLIPFPPLEEQKAIVKIVNQLMTEVDELEAQTKTRVQLRHDFIKSSLRQLTTADSASVWKKLQQQFTSFFDTVESIDKLKEAILQLAVQGKLTKQWRKDNPDVEPASVLLEKIKEEKARLIKEKRIKKEKPLPEITEEEIPFGLPEGWTWSRMGPSMLKITDGTHHSPSNSETGDYKYISAKNIKSDGLSYKNLTFVSEEIHHEIYARCNPEKGDILYIKDGATTGIGCINPLDEQFSMLSSVALLKTGQLLSEYVLLAMKSPYYYDYIRGDMSGVAITRVTLTKLKYTIIPIPPLPEQKVIVEIVNQLTDYCNQIKSEIINRKTFSKDFLRSSIREVMEKTQSLA